MKYQRSIRSLLPLIMIVMSVLLLIRIYAVDASVLVPERVDVVVLVVALCGAIIVALHHLVSISMGYLRQLSIQRARRETLAEHSRFLRRLDHELKNPITALHTGLKTLALTELTDQQQHVVKTMETETLHLARLVTDLRKLAELEAEPLTLQEIDLAAFVRSIERSEGERFHAAGRTLTCRLAGPATSWVADEDLMVLAIHNLLDNAFKYTHQGDIVALTVMGDNELVIEVKDTGDGIAQDALPYVWEELYRADQSVKVAGRGVGLALVKAIVERHDGRVQIESSPDVGTTVVLRLPRISQN